MTHKYEQRYLIDLAFRITNSFSARSVVAQELSSWAEDQDLGFDWDPEVDRFKRKGLPGPVWSDLRNRLADRNDCALLPRPDTLLENLTLLADYVGLSPEERCIFELAVRAARSGPVKSLCNALVDDARIPVRDAVHFLSGLSSAYVRRALAPTGRLLPKFDS